MLSIDRTLWLLSRVEGLKSGVVFLMSITAGELFESLTKEETWGEENFLGEA